MSNDKEIAKYIVEKASDVIMKERPGVHGSVENSFQMIADLWSVYLKHIHYARQLTELKIDVKPQDVAQMMVLLKQARSIYGDSTNTDNYVDAVGYAALAGMLNMPDPKRSE